MCKKYIIQCSRCLGRFHVDNAPPLDDEEYICEHCCLGDFEPDEIDYERGLYYE